MKILYFERPVTIWYAKTNLNGQEMKPRDAGNAIQHNFTQRLHLLRNPCTRQLLFAMAPPLTLVGCHVCGFQGLEDAD